MTPHNSKTTLLLLAVIFFSLILTPQPSYSGAGAPAVKTEAEIRAILVKWRDTIKPTLNQAHVAEVEKQANALPLENPQGTFPVTYDDSETDSAVDVKTKANRRDWAYALDGFLYTLIGGVGDGQADKLDLGFWCFIEAALLQMIPDHLNAIAFHLNERGEYDDAISVLHYVCSLNPYLPSARNNLAYALSGKGDHKSAYNEMSQAVSLSPDNERFKKKLKYYADQAGINVPKDPSGQAAQTPSAMPSQAYLSVFQSIVSANQTFHTEFMNHRWNTIFNSCYSSANPSSAKSVYYNSLTGLDDARETCIKNCYPAPGIIPDNLDNCICKCTMMWAQNRFAAANQFHDYCRPQVETWAKESQDALELLVEAMFDQVTKEKNNLTKKEMEDLDNIISDLYLGANEGIRTLYDSSMSDIMVVVKQDFEILQSTSDECGKKLSAASPKDPMDLFGKAPLKLRRVSDSGKIWNIWFFFGDLKLYPDDTAKLSIGVKGIASIKLKYNFQTGDKGAGVGLGLNVGKLLGPPGEAIIKNTMKFEFFANVDSATGGSWGFESGFRPKVGVLPGDSSATMMRLEN
jgi:hypothetical protein